MYKIRQAQICLAIMLLLAACSPLDIIKGAMGGGDGIDATVQVAEDANKGAIALQASTKTEVGDVQGNSEVVTNSSTSLLIGMIPFLLLCFYLLPAPKWVHKIIDRRNK
tara:strand:- start:454 stop:780 length:327 start_codon:yes stop_codon:yes gene_type:complete